MTISIDERRKQDMLAYHYYQQGLSFRAIGKIMGRTHKTVGAMVKRAQQYDSSIAKTEDANPTGFKGYRKSVCEMKKDEVLAVFYANPDKTNLAIAEIVGGINKRDVSRIITKYADLTSEQKIARRLARTSEAQQAHHKEIVKRIRAVLSPSATVQSLARDAHVDPKTVLKAVYSGEIHYTEIPGQKWKWSRDEIGGIYLPCKPSKPQENQTSDDKPTHLASSAVRAARKTLGNAVELPRRKVTITV